ncbi:hypothetical protein AX16_004281 [Volvariella volvacea WC 439]|nr:hypothetical protein AX16_004281 [Volvariella volvacea WC 439]
MPSPPAKQTKFPRFWKSTSPPRNRPITSGTEDRDSSRLHIRRGTAGSSTSPVSVPAQLEEEPIQILGWRRDFDHEYKPAPDPDINDIFEAEKPFELDEELRDSSLNDLLARFHSMSTSAKDRIFRPDFGSGGRPIQLRTNFFRLRVSDKSLYEYNVSITFAKESTDKRLISQRMKQKIFELAEATEAWKGLVDQIAHDYSSTLVSSKELPGESLTITVPFHETSDCRNKEKRAGFRVVMTPSRVLSVGTLLRYLGGDINIQDDEVFPILKALDIILTAPSRRYKQATCVASRRFFFPNDQPKKPEEIGDGLQGRRGFYVGSGIAHRQVVVNIDVSTMAFYSPMQMRDLGFREWEEVRYKLFVKGLRVAVRNTNNSERRGTIHYLYDDKSSDVTLVHPDYFENPRVLSVDKRVTAEYCSVLPNQPFRGILTPQQIKKLIEYATESPAQVARLITADAMHLLSYNASPTLHSFGISVTNDMMSVPGRVIPPPRIRYGRAILDVGPDTRWDPRTVPSTFQSAVKLDKWAVIIISDGDDNPVDQLGENAPLGRKIRTHIDRLLITAFRRMGIDVLKAPLIGVARLPEDHRSDPFRKGVINVIGNVISSMVPAPSFLFFLLANEDRGVYAAIKHKFEVDVGAAHTCMQTKKLLNSDDVKYVLGVAMKVNMKIGGRNQTIICPTLDFLQSKPTLLVGLNVWYPSSHLNTPWIPPVGACASNIDDHFSQFAVSLALQALAQKVMTDLPNMLSTRIMEYKERNGVWPERLIIFRHDIPEEERDKIISAEMKLIYSAFDKITVELPRGKYLPKFALIASSQQHHARFFPANVASAYGHGNPPPGTVVDQGVLSGDKFDFFLQYLSLMIFRP